jgi:hypothetical protein
LAIERSLKNGRAAPMAVDGEFGVVVTPDFCLEAPQFESHDTDCPQQRISVFVVFSRGRRRDELSM